MSSFRLTEYVEDAAAVANPQGPMTMARRKDTLASEVTTDGDNIALNATSKGELYVKQTDAVPVTDNGGSLTVDGTVAVSGTVAVTQSGTWDEVGINDSGNSITVDAPVGTPVFVRLSDGSAAITTLPVSLASVPSHAVTNAGTFATQVDGAALTALQLIDDIVKAVDSVAGGSDAGVPLLAVRDDATATLTPIDGDYTHLRVNSEGALHVNLWNPLSSAIDSVSAVQSGTWTEANSAAIAASASVLDDWDESDRAKVNLIVGQAGVAAGAGAVGATVQRVTLASDDPAVTALQIMDDWDNAASDGASVSGDTAHDAADAGEPVKVGGKAYSFDGTAPGTAVAEGDRANFITDLEGRQFVETTHPNHFSLFEDHTSAQTNNQLKAAPGANLSIYITDVVVSNGATAGTLKLVEDVAGTPVQIGQTLYLGINGGAVINWKTPKKLTTNMTLGFTSATVTTHSIEVHGFIAP